MSRTAARLENRSSLGLYPPSMDLGSPTTQSAVSVIVPVLDEQDHVEQLATALFNQTLVPDEVVFADGGSTDGTREILDRLAAGDRRIRVVDGPGGIAENRNAAIEAARNPIIACIDAGCVPDRSWLERVTESLRSRGADWVSGIALPVTRSGAASVAGLVFLSVPEEIDPVHHVPPGASQAFHKKAWGRVGGFPEGMTAAEDTHFGHRMIGAGYRPQFRPDAIVRWDSPTGPAVLVKAFQWGRADGRAESADDAYMRLLAEYWLPVVVAVGLSVMGLDIAAAAFAAVPLGFALHRVRHRWRYLEHLWQRAVLPVVYVVKTQAQTLGWLFGLVDRSTLRTVAHHLVRPVRFVTVNALRVIRPLVPDAIVGRIRRRSLIVRQESAPIDVFVDDKAEAQRWLLGTPSTYRIRSGVGLSEATSISDVVVIVGGALDSDLKRLLLRPFADPEIEVSVVAEATLRPIRRKSVDEPELAVLAVAVRKGVGDLAATDDPAVVLHTARQAALKIALTPRPVTGLPTGRNDLIGDPGSVVILAAVPMHDVGGGSRGAQLAQEFLSRGYHVVYSHLFDAAESVDLGLRYVHPNLETVPVEGPDLPLDRLLDRLADRLRTQHRLVIVEIPHRAILPALKRLRDEGYTVVYDLIDDWADPALGFWGYSPRVESDVLVAADFLIASAASLVESLEKRARRPVALVPNAVNTRLFGPGDHPRPDDLPAGDGPMFEYHGSLYGDWFDWDGLAGVAAAFPAARIVVIGDEPNDHPVMPDNVWFLGLKPQHQLAAYLAHSRVGLLPFVVSETTHAVSPLKVYEYLAMGLPVAAPPLRSLRGLQGVFTGDDLADAVAAALAGEPPDPERVRAEHSWQERVARILDTVGLESSDQGDPVRISIRSIPRYSESARRLF